MDRELRQPPAQAEFDTIAIPRPAHSPPLPRVRLGNANFRSQFFANPRSRLTPISGQFACVYLAADRETAVAEVWGDRFWSHRAHHASVYGISRAIAAASAFMEASPPHELRLCDLTDSDVRLALGVDSGTLYSPDLALPRTWAERIARHPAGFDGILYRSRITDEPCAVLWLRPGGRALDREMNFTTLAPFLNSSEAFAVAAKCGVRLAFLP